MAKHLPIKDKLRTPGHLPEDYNWEHMSEGIYNKIEIAAERNSKLSTSNKIALYLAGMMVVVLSTCLFIKNTHQDHADQLLANPDELELTKASSSTKQLINSNYETSESVLPGDSKTVVVQEVSLPSSAAYDLELENIQRKFKPTVKNQDHESRTAAQINLSAISSSDEVSAFDVSRKMNRAQNDHNNTLSSALKMQTRPTEVNTSNIVGQKAIKGISFTPFSKLTTLRTFIARDHSDIHINGAQQSLIKPQITLMKKWGFAIQLNGAAMLTDHSGSTYSDARSDNESTELGYAAKARLSYQINRRLAIATGVDYYKLNTKFDYYSERDTLVNQEVLVAQEHNIVSGQIKEIYEYRTLSAVNWKSVQHYNNYQLLSIPIVINYTWLQHADIEMSSGLGAQLMLTGSASGRTLGEEFSEGGGYEVRYFGNSDYNFGFKTGWNANTQIDYALSDYLSIGYNLTLSQSFNNLSLMYDDNFRPLVFDTGIHLKFSF